MIAIYFDNCRDSNTVELTNEWLKDNSINVNGFFIDVNDDIAEIATKHGLTVFPVIVSIGNFGKDDKEIFIKYAEGLDAIRALTPDIIEQIKADVMPPPAV